MTRNRICMNCHTSYASALRKCPEQSCRASRRFSSAEGLSAHEARQAEQAKLIDLLNSFICEA